MDKNDWFRQLRERIALTTPGPWRFINDSKIPKENRIQGSAGQFICKGAEDISPWSITKENGEFIANSRTDIELLIKIVEEYEQRISKKDSEHDE